MILWRYVFNKTILEKNGHTYIHTCNWSQIFVTYIHVCIYQNSRNFGFWVPVPNRDAQRVHSCCVVSDATSELHEEGAGPAGQPLKSSCWGKSTSETSGETSRVVTVANMSHVDVKNLRPSSFEEEYYDQYDYYSLTDKYAGENTDFYLH